MSEDRILFVADDTPDGPIPRWASTSIDQAKTVHVITPVLGSRIERATDSDEPTRRAASRLNDLMSGLGFSGAEVTGEVITDPPFEAVKRMLLDHEYDRIIVGIRAETHWKEDDLIGKLRQVTDVPVEEVTVGNNEK
jgi:hypothetical protein